MAELSYGDSGFPVRSLQTHLAGAGYDCGPVDGQFGPRTQRAVMRLQHDHGLRESGVVDEGTVKALLSAPQRRATVADAALDMARSFLGTRETGHNDGATVRRFLADVGLHAGAPWCMAFVQYCVHLAASALEIPDPLKPDSGHCLTVWRGVPASKRFAPEQAKPGDVFIMRFAGDAGHTGFVESVDGGKAVCIEGNTDGSGGREGDGVYRRNRALRSFVGVIRL